MIELDVLKNAFSMPVHSPSFPRGPYRFIDREYLIIAYRTDPELLESLLPAPLRLAEPIVKYEFINMPDSTGFGHYCESGQVIPVTLDGVHGSFVLSMFLNDESPIAGGREIWGFPKKYGKPKLRVKKDTLIGTLDYSGIQIARGTMGYKHAELPHDKVLASMLAPNFLLKVIPHVDGSPRICELVQYELSDVTLKGAWTGPGSLDLHPHALAPIAQLPVREILSTTHILADLTLPYGRVVHDYLKVR